MGYVRPYLRAYLILGFALTAVGCGTINKINTVQTDKYVYAGNYKSMTEMVEKAKVLENKTTTCPDGIVAAGFDPKMNNVQELPGAAGAEHFSGTKNIQPQDPEKLKLFVEEFALYTTYLFPIVDTDKVKKFIYAYEQVEVTTGIDAYYVITCRDGVVIFHGRGGRQMVDEKVTEARPGGNWLMPVIAALGILGAKIMGMF